MFDLENFLATTGLTRSIRRFPAGSRVFAQGTVANAVFYVQEGQVKLVVVSPGGKEAVIAVLVDGDFFGEGCLAGQTHRMASASTITT